MSVSFDYGDFELVPRPQSDFARIFKVKRQYVLRKASRFGGHLRYRQDGSLDRETALHWVLHHRHGAALRDRLNLPADEVADLLVRAAQMHPANKREEVPTMNRIEKNLRAMGEAEYTRIVGDYAKKLYPELSRERAFAKVFEAPDAEGVAIRKCWQLSKQGILDDDSAADAAGEVEDDAMDQLEELAQAERRRDPKLTKAQAFSKIYTDPANADLAQRERRANRPRA